MRLFMYSRIAGLLFVSTLAVPATAQVAAPATPSPQELAALWDREHVSSPLPPLVDHQEVVKRLTELRKDASGLYKIEQVGASIEGRSINMVTAGDGTFRVLLW